MRVARTGVAGQVRERRLLGGALAASQGATAPTVWLFDLDNTLHDASKAAFPYVREAMGHYIARHLAMPLHDAGALREHYLKRYGATLAGLVKHHGVKAAHFLEDVHNIDGLEQRLRTHAPDRAALKALPGRKVLLTNAPRSYALRVLRHLGLAVFDEVLSVEDMTMFGHVRPKPDVRTLRHLVHRLGVQPSQCVLVEDTLANLKAARRLGMRTVWMQAYLPEVFKRQKGVKPPMHSCRKPPTVCARIHELRTLHSLWPRLCHELHA